MTGPRRIQRQRTAGSRMPEGARYVGRPSRWGNPFRIYHGHTTIGPAWSVARATWGHIPASECVNAYMTSSKPLGAAEVVELYRSLLRVRARDESDRLAEWLRPLIGRHLACWCPLDQACHTDVLLDLIKTLCVLCRRLSDHDTLVCCSSHSKVLCHACYRRTHFVQVCHCGRPACAEEVSRVA